MIIRSVMLTIKGEELGHTYFLTSKDAQLNYSSSVGEKARKKCYNKPAH